MRRLRVAACQINTSVGDIDGNVDLILGMLEQAEAVGADVAVFPEMTVCGYPPEDLVLKPGFVADCQEAVVRIAATTGACAALIGTVAAGRGAAGADDRFNTVVLCADGKVVLEYHKRLLPNYAVFDERRYFSPGTGSYTLVEIRGVKIGVAICEDIWTPIGPMSEQVAGGAEVMLVPNGSPYRTGRANEREAMLRV